jgi:hypothetical protein
MSIKAHFHSGKFSAERKFCKMWLADTNFPRKKILKLKVFNFLTMIFSENFLSVEIFLEWKWAFKQDLHLHAIVSGQLEQKKPGEIFRRRHIFSVSGNPPLLRHNSDKLRCCNCSSTVRYASSLINPPIILDNLFLTISYVRLL